MRLNREPPQSHKTETEQEDPEFYVLTASETKARIVDNEKGWAKIKWNAKTFEPDRRRWDRIADFLKTQNKPTHRETE